MKHCLRELESSFVLLWFYLFIYLVIIAGRVEASRQSEGWEYLLNRSSHHSYEIQNQIVHCNYITRINKIIFLWSFSSGLNDKSLDPLLHVWHTNESLERKIKVVAENLMSVKYCENIFDKSPLPFPQWLILKIIYIYKIISNRPIDLYCLKHC